MADTAPDRSITIESPFGTLVTNAASLAQFAAALADIARRADTAADAEPLAFDIGGIRCICHTGGGGLPIA